MKTPILCFFFIVSSLAVIMQDNQNPIPTKIPLVPDPAFKPIVTSSKKQSIPLNISTKTNTFLKGSLTNFVIASSDPPPSSNQLNDTNATKATNEANATDNLHSAIMQGDRIMFSTDNIPILDTRTVCSAGPAKERDFILRDVNSQLMKYEITKKLLILHCTTTQNKRFVGSILQTGRDLLIFATNLGLIEIEVNVERGGQVYVVRSQTFSEVAKEEISQSS